MNRLLRNLFHNVVMLLLFSFLFYFIFAFSFKDMLSNKMFFPKPCMMMHFLFSRHLVKDLILNLNISYLIKSQVS